MLLVQNVSARKKFSVSVVVRLRNAESPLVDLQWSCTSCYQPCLASFQWLEGSGKHILPAFIARSGGTHTSLWQCMPSFIPLLCLAWVEVSLLKLPLFFFRSDALEALSSLMQKYIQTGVMGVTNPGILNYCVCQSISQSKHLFANPMQ